MFACSPANPNPEIGKPQLPLALDAGPTGPGFATPSKWALSFSQRWRGVASLELDSGSTLHAGDGGERWIESVTGNNDGAATIAPERIVGIQKADGIYRFVGASGAVYVAHEPLGTLAKTGGAVEGARQVAVGKTAILVVDGKGDLQRSTDGGRSWAKIDVPQREGVIVDIAMLADKGILVVAPQRFYGTKDDGVTWTLAKSPGIGVQSVVARDGALWVDGVEENMRFDAAWGTFSAGSAPTHSLRKPFSKTNAAVTLHRIDGRRAIQITGNGTERVWSLALGDMGAVGKPRKIDELDGCEVVDAAMRGDDVVISCDARGTVSGGIDKDATAPVQKFNYGRNSGAPDGGTLGWVTRVLRSNDGGRTFHEEATVEGGIPQQRVDAAIALGPDDFIYLGRRCGAGYNAACLPARVRASKSAGFSELPSEDDGSNNASTNGHVRFATSASSATAYSIGIHDNEAFLFRWKSGSAVPEPVGRIGQSVDAQSATLSVDDEGVVRGFLRVGQNGMVFSYKQGAAVTSTPLQIPVARGAFFGQHGFAVTSAANDAKAYESLDGGKTWGLVAAPAFVASVDACTSFGCVTDRGVRWGWDAPTGTADGGATPKKEAKASYARPLRCSAKDKWVELGGGNLPNVSYVDHGGVRWLLPTRDKDGKIALVTSKRGEATTKTTSAQLMGAPPGPPKFGSGTTVHVQPDGVVALRYVYNRERKGPGRYNPVDAQLAWYRDASGKILHANANKNPPFRVNKDPQGGYQRDQQPMYSELPELVSLSSKGVYFHAGSLYEEDDTGTGDPKRVPLMLLRDDGKVEKLSLPEGVDNSGGSALVASLEGTTTLLSRNPESWTATNLSDGKRTFYSVLGGLGEDDGAVDLVTLGGKSVLAATLRDPARAWLIGLKPETELGAATAIATQKSLGDVPKACDGAPASDPSAYRIDAPWVLGSRRPVVVDSDGVAIVMATDRAEIRGTTSSADACVAAFDAMVPSEDDDRDYSALVFTDDLAHSLLFRADTSVWPAPIAVRAMECQYQAGPLPEELEQVEGFTPDDRHSAVPRKRY